MKTKPDLGPSGPYATKEDRWMARECGTTVKQLRQDRSAEDVPVITRKCSHCGKPITTTLLRQCPKCIATQAGI